MSTSKLLSIPLAEIVVTKDNPRIISAEDPKMKELAESIKALGVLEPVLCRPHENKKAKFELRAGARRFVAAKMAGLSEIPSIVREMNDEEAFAVTIVENLQRDDLQPLEEARGINSMLSKGWAVPDIAAHIGKSPSWVVRRAQLTALSERWQKEIEDPKGIAVGAPAGHLELIARLPEDAQNDALTRMKGRYYDKMVAHMSFKKLEDDLGSYTQNLRSAKWSLADEDLVPDAGACLLCNKRSSSQPGLFDDFGAGEDVVKKNDRCLDTDCWGKKLKAFTVRKHEELKKEHPAVLLTMDNSSYGAKAFVEGDTVSAWQYDKAKKTDPKAVPIITVSGENAGRVEWVKPKKGEKAERQVERQKKAARKDSERGNSQERKLNAQDFACAWSCLAFANEAYGAQETSNAILPVMKREAEVMALVALSERTGRSGPPRNWLKECLEIARKAPEWILDRFKDEDTRVFIVALGLFDYIQSITSPDRHYNPDAILKKAKAKRFGFPADTLRSAAETFVPPASYFEEHRKDDLLIIGKQMGLPVKATMRAQDLKSMLSKASETFRDVRAGNIKEMPEKWANYSPLAEDLANAFGQPWTPPTAAAAKALQAKKRGRLAKEQKCRLCGCTESTPCIDVETGDPCHWVKPDLCSACVDKVKKNAPKKAIKKANKKEK